MPKTYSLAASPRVTDKVLIGDVFKMQEDPGDCCEPPGCRKEAPPPPALFSFGDQAAPKLRCFGCGGFDVRPYGVNEWPWAWAFGKSMTTGYVPPDEPVEERDSVGRITTKTVRFK